MALSVKNDQADRLARELTALTGESITDAVIAALSERLERTRATASVASRLERLSREIADIPVLDRRPPDEILGYDESGMP